METGVFRAVSPSCQRVGEEVERECEKYNHEEKGLPGFELHDPGIVRAAGI